MTNKDFKKISINLSTNQVEHIEKLIRANEYMNMSEFIRESVRLRLEKKSMCEHEFY